MLVQIMKVFGKCVYVKKEIHELVRFPLVYFTERKIGLKTA